MKSIRGAFSLLTRFPARGAADAGSVVWFFLPALCVGALSAAVFWGASFLHIAYFSALCSVMTELLATGALHADGFADVCDAFLCPATPERRVEILHDSRLGTFGVLGLAFDVGARILLVGSLPPDLPALLALTAVPVAGKTALIVCLLSSRAAPGSRMGAGLIGKIGRGPGAVALIASGACAAVLCGPVRGALAIGAACVAGLLMTATARRNIGGSNGDVLGAANELGEICCLVILAAGAS